jgi:hypothetical protein
VHLLRQELRQPLGIGARYVRYVYLGVLHRTRVRPEYVAPPDQDGYECTHGRVQTPVEREYARRDQDGGDVGRDHDEHGGKYVLVLLECTDDVEVECAGYRTRHSECEGVLGVRCGYECAPELRPQDPVLSSTRIHGRTTVKVQVHSE